MEKVTDKGIEVLQTISVNPGITAMGLLHRTGIIQAVRGGILRDLETAELIVYRNDGWHVTGKGDNVIGQEGPV